MLELPLIPQKHQESNFYIPDVVLSETNLLGVSNGYSQGAPLYESTSEKPTSVVRRNNEYHPPVSERPIFASTPQHEPSSLSVTEASAVNPVPLSCDPKYDTEYFSRKAKRISRLYTDSHSFDQFDAIDVDISLLDYLVRHGAISESTSQQILLARPADRKAMLLASLGVPVFGDQLTCGALHPSNSVSTTGFALLINALRHTGHHSLASQLDIGRRITPSPGLVACEIESHGERSLFEHRRRGQLSLWIQLEAIKVDPAIYQDLIAKSDNNKNEHVNKNNNNLSATSKSSNSVVHSPVHRVTPVHLADRSKKPSLGSPPTCLPSSVWIDHDTVTSTVLSERLSVSSSSATSAINARRPVGCFPKLSCMFRLKRRKQKSRSSPLHLAVSQPAKNGKTTKTAPDVNSCDRKPSFGSIRPVDDIPAALSNTDALAVAKLTLLDTKSGEFYRLLLDPDSTSHESLVKYFEQSCGVLVLDCCLSPFRPTKEPKSDGTSPSVLHLFIVATQTERVKRLWTASDNNECRQSTSPTPRNDPVSGSRLENELTEALSGAGVLELLQLQDLRLSVRLDPHEVELAIDELSDFVE
ncbi:hypothetical protein CRM22_002614 [Opisthorchis felineus]|uniref:Uncharacterized protein n=1 Tax=Opisthorchis felineus TaxID=147828 RepID=A0A4S2MBH7_OPIFE|nr:hypothetical protein CRM22_002614 [Opisthorchis felineus]